MGAGKTTVGRLLAPMLGWRFVDTDAVLVERHGAPIASLFTEYGEPQFREWEAAAVASTLAQDEVVIAFGGGSVEHSATRDLLFSDAAILTAFLETPLSVALARCASEPKAATRPVLVNTGRLHDRYAMRLPFYRSAQLTVTTEARTPAALARDIAETAKSQF